MIPWSRSTGAAPGTKAPIPGPFRRSTRSTTRRSTGPMWRRSSRAERPPPVCTSPSWWMRSWRSFRSVPARWATTPPWATAATPAGCWSSSRARGTCTPRTWTPRRWRRPAPGWRRRGTGRKSSPSSTGTSPMWTGWPPGSSLTSCWRTWGCPPCRSTTRPGASPSSRTAPWTCGWTPPPASRRRSGCGSWTRRNWKICWWRIPTSPTPTASRRPSPRCSAGAARWTPPASSTPSSRVPSPSSPPPSGRRR